MRADQFNRSIDQLVSPPPAGAGGVQIEHPLQLQNATAGGTAGVRVRFGQLNSITPQISGVDIAADTGPILTFPGAGVYLVYLHVVVSDTPTVGTITALTVEENTSLPSDTDTDSYLTIGQVTVDSTPKVTLIEQSVTHSLQFTRCGRIKADGEASPPVAAVPGAPEYWGI